MNCKIVQHGVASILHHTSHLSGWLGFDSLRSLMKSGLLRCLFHHFAETCTRISCFIPNYQPGHIIYLYSSEHDCPLGFVFPLVSYRKWVLRLSLASLLASAWPPQGMCNQHTSEESGFLRLGFFLLVPGFLDGIIHAAKCGWLEHKYRILRATCRGDWGSIPCVRMAWWNITTFSSLRWNFHLDTLSQTQGLFLGHIIYYTAPNIVVLNLFFPYARPPKNIPSLPKCLVVSLKPENRTSGSYIT